MNELELFVKPEVIILIVPSILYFNAYFLIKNDT